MVEKVTIPQQHLNLDDITTLFDMVGTAFNNHNLFLRLEEQIEELQSDSASNIHNVFHGFGEKMAVKYCANINIPKIVHEILSPKDILKGVLNILAISNWFDSIVMEQKGNEIRIILQSINNEHTNKGTYDFLTGFVEALTASVLHIRSRPKIKIVGYDMYILVFQTMKKLN